MLNSDNIDEMPGWCAGIKVTGLADVVRRKLTLSRFFSEVLNLAQQFRGECSVIVVSVNEEELDQIAWLKENKFKKCPWFKNYIHGDRRTCLYMKQIPKKLYKEYFGA